MIAPTHGGLNRYASVLCGVLALGTSGCYLTHGAAPTAESDGGRRRDTGLGRDGGRRPDTGTRRDAGLVLVEGCEGEFAVLDRLELAWEALDCGGARAPQVVRRGPRSRFQLVVTESRSCRDRPAYVWTRSLTASDGRLEATESISLGIASDIAYAASTSDDVAVCSGRALYVDDGGSDGFLESELREDPMSEPGCPRYARCRGLAPDADGWGAIWDTFDCDVGFHEMSRSFEGGGLREPAFQTGQRLRSITSDGDSLVALSGSRGTATPPSLYRWRPTEGSPEELPLEPSPVDLDGWGPGAVVHWPFVDGSWAVVVAGPDATIALRVVDEAGRTLMERIYDGAVIPGYGVASIELAVTGFGLVVGVGQVWEGGRVGSASTLLVIDARGDATDLGLGEEVEPDTGPVVVDVASDGEYAVAHRSLSAGRTEVLLLGCR